MMRGTLFFFGNDDALSGFLLGLLLTESTVVHCSAPETLLFQLLCFISHQQRNKQLLLKVQLVHKVEETTVKFSNDDGVLESDSHETTGSTTSLTDDFSKEIPGS